MKAIHALERNERYATVARHQGRKVRIVWSGLRDRKTAEELVGELVSVASSLLRTGTELAIVRRSGKVDRAVSLATIFSIEELDE